MSLKELWKSNREFTAMIAMPTIAITLVLFPENFCYRNINIDDK